MNILKKTTIALSVASLLAGCSMMNPNHTSNNLGKIIEDYKMLQKLREESFALSGGQNDYMSSDEIYVIGDSFEVTASQALPPVFTITAGYGSPDPKTISEHVSTLNQALQRYAVVITITDDANNYANNYAVSQDDVDIGGSEPDDTKFKSPFEAIKAQQLLMQGKSAAPVNNYTAPVFSSRNDFLIKLQPQKTTLESVLNILTANAGLSWRFTAGVVEIYRNEEKTYSIDAPAQTYAAQYQQQSSRSSEGSSNSSGASVSSNASNALESVFRQIESLKSSTGQIILDEFASTVTVVDTPSRQRIIKAFIDKYNKASGQTFAVRTDLYEIVMDVTDDKTLSLMALFEEDNILSTIASPVNVAAGAVNIGVEIPETVKKWGGSKVLLDAIARDSNVASHIVKTSRTRNNVPVLLASNEERTIVQGSETTVQDGISQTDLKFKTINTGFNFNIKPSLASDGRINIDVTTNTRTLKDLTTVTTESTESQLDDIKGESTVVNTVVTNAQPIVVTGYERILTEGEASSILADLPWWVGGSKRGRTFKSTLLIVITPTKTRD